MSVSRSLPMPDVCKMTAVSTSRRLARTFRGMVFAVALMMRTGCLAADPPAPPLSAEGTRALDEGLPQVAAYKLRAFLQTDLDPAARRTTVLTLVRALLAEPDAPAALALLDKEYRSRDDAVWPDTALQGLDLPEPRRSRAAPLLPPRLVRRADAGPDRERHPRSVTSTRPTRGRWCALGHLLVPYGGLLAIGPAGRRDAGGERCHPAALAAPRSPRGLGHGARPGSSPPDGTSARWTSWPRRLGPAGPAGPDDRGTRPTTGTGVSAAAAGAGRLRARPAAADGSSALPGAGRGCARCAPGGARGPDGWCGRDGRRRADAPLQLADAQQHHRARPVEMYPRDATRTARMVRLVPGRA